MPESTQKICDEDILDQLGLKIGHYTDTKNLTGLTCFIANQGANIGVDIRGSNTGTFNTPAYDAKAASQLIHGIVLTGGSTFGLESAFGTMQFLEQNDIGYRTRGGVIPGMAGAVIYDIAVGNGHVRPTKSNGYIAAESASNNKPAQGNVGVGTGATVGKWIGGVPMKGGFGFGVTEIAKDLIVAAFAVTNAMGDVINPTNGKFYSDSGQQRFFSEMFSGDLQNLQGLMHDVPTNTTLAVIATNLQMEKTQLMKVAELAHDGMARAIHPIHTNLDGDVIFAISSLSSKQKVLSEVSSLTRIDLIGLAAADALMKAIDNSIAAASSIPGFPAYKSNY